MKNSYIMEEEQYAYTFIKKWSVCIIILELILAMATGLLYRFDHKEEDVNLIKRFIMNEYELCYPYRDELLSMCEQCDSVSELIEAYNSNRLEYTFHYTQIEDHEWILEQPLHSLIKNARLWFSNEVQRDIVLRTRERTHCQNKQCLYGLTVRYTV